MHAFTQLLESLIYTRSRNAKLKLRAHSALMWNRAVNRLVAAHLTWCDVEVEAKGKNRASRGLAEQLRAEAAG